MKQSPHVAIVGSTGAVGLEMVQTLERRRFPLGKLTLLASARSAGKSQVYQGEELTVGELKADSFAGVDLALFSAGAGTSREFAPAAVEAGAVVVDNSSAFRMDEEVPLVVPEINPDDATRHRGIIANPNCSTIVALMALFPLHRELGLLRFFAATYQAVSGSGARAVAELKQQLRQVVDRHPVTRSVYPHQIACNVLPQVDVFLDSGYTKEEMKMVNESRKIMHLPELRGSVTCVRVPVYRAHSIAINAEFARPVDVDRARQIIAAADGVEVIDDPEQNAYPLPLEQAGKDACAVGRLRRDTAFDNGLSFWVVGDQLLKGAALNAVQIAELLLP